MTRWFRMYDDVLNDPKAQQLSDAAFRGWVNLMCLASKNDGILEQPLENVAFSLRKSLPKTKELFEILEAAGLLDRTETGWKPHNWEARQYKSDVSTARVKRFRDRSSNVAETPPETEQIQKQSRTEKKVVRAACAAIAADESLALQAFNEVAGELKWPQAQRLTPSRASKIAKRLSECGGIDGWRAAMAKARASPWLRGDVPRGKGFESWAPDLDFFLQESSFTKLMEGKYDQRGRVTATGFDAIREGASRAAGLDRKPGPGVEGA